MMDRSAMLESRERLFAGSRVRTELPEPSFVVFLLLTFVLLGRPQDFFPALAPLRLALVLTILCLAITYKRFLSMGFFKSLESKKYIFFYLLMIAGIPFAYHRRIAFDYIFLLYLSNILFFYLCLVHIDSFKKLKTTLLVITLSALLYSAFSLAMGAFSSGRFFFGAMYDPNDLAYLLVSLFPLSLYFVSQTESPAKRITGIAAAVASIAAILFSGSRGGFIGFAAVVLMLLFSKNARLKRLAKLSVIGGVIFIALLSGEKINMERYLTLKNVSEDYNLTDEFGRKRIWEKGLQFVLANPLTGVGVNCFGKAIGELRAARGEIPKWQAAHNSYLQVAAETGLIGLAVFLSLIMQSWKNLKKRINNAVDPGQRELNEVAGFLHAGFAGSLLAAFFLSQGYSILFTLYFALAAVLRKLSNVMCETGKQRKGCSW